jgi:hypothetical protein
MASVPQSGRGLAAAIGEGLPTLANMAAFAQ